jgi:hypothetical protein
LVLQSSGLPAKGFSRVLLNDYFYKYFKYFYEYVEHLIKFEYVADYVLDIEYK